MSVTELESTFLQWDIVRLLLTTILVGVVGTYILWSYTRAVASQGVVPSTMTTHPSSKPDADKDKEGGDTPPPASSEASSSEVSVSPPTGGCSGASKTGSSSCYSPNPDATVPSLSMDSSAQGCCGGEEGKKGQGGCCSSSSSSSLTKAPDTLSTPLHITLFYASCTGTAKSFAVQLAQRLDKERCTLQDLATYDPENLFTHSGHALFILPAYDADPDSSPCQPFLTWLEEARHDHRVERQALADLSYSMFALGDTAYTDTYALAGRRVDKWLNFLGAKRIFPQGKGDKATGK